MAESDLHRTLMLDLIDVADRRFQSDLEFYVSGNLFIYYEEGHPEKAVAPDFFVVRGVRKGPRRVYKLWEEKKSPQLVIELTSPSTHLEDLGNKRAIYEELEVQEYFIFDPEGGRFQPAARGFALKQGAFQQIRPTLSEGGKTIFSSSVLGLELHGQGQSLRLVDPATGEALPTSKELERRLEQEKRRAEAAEKELAKLREELARFGARPPS